MGGSPSPTTYCISTSEHLTAAPEALSPNPPYCDAGAPSVSSPGCMRVASPRPESWQLSWTLPQGCFSPKPKFLPQNYTGRRGGREGGREGGRLSTWLGFQMRVTL